MHRHPSSSLLEPIEEGAKAVSRAPESSLRIRHLIAPLAIGIPALVLMFVVSRIEDLPIRDPDARYVGSPLALIALIVAAFLILDLVPRAIGQARSSQTGFVEALRRLFDERWWGRRGLIVVVCILGFYATYLAYRNLKSFLPFVTNGTLHDDVLIDLDQVIFFGSDPANLLHDLLGTGIAADGLSAVYLAFLTFVPLSLGVALIWSSRVAAGLWYVTALAIDWLLGALSYYLLPTLGPIYARPEIFTDLPETRVSQLQGTLLEHRAEVIRDPYTSDAVQSIAGFASLHVAVILTAALIAQFVGAPRLLRIGMWIFFALTMIATIYFGWHYSTDDLAAVAIAAIAVYGGGFLVGFRPPPFGDSVALRERSRDAVSVCSG